MTSARQATRRMTAQQIGGTTDPIGARGSRPEVVQWIIDPLPSQSRPPVGPGGPPDRRPSRRVTLAVAGALLAVVLAVVLAAVVATGRGSSSDPSTFASTAPRTLGRPPLAVGWQRVSSLGVEVDAPASWPTNTWSGCGVPPVAQITRAPGGVAGCGRSPDAPVVISTLAILSPGEGIYYGITPVATVAPTTRVDTTRAGLPVTISTQGLPRGRTETVITFPGRDVEVAAASSDPALVRRIIASAWPVAVDSIGCATDLPPEPNWDTAATGPAVDLSDPSSITVCYYPGGGTGHQVLGASTVITGVAAHRAAATINSARPGPVPDQPTSCAADAFGGRLVLHVREPDNSTVEARMKFEGCTDRRIATSTGVSQATRAQATALMTPLRTSYGSDGDLPER